jgi:AcrR family transcriptional regulator
MPSSGIYRYFPSRDELLTALIVDAYAELAAAAQRAVDRAGDDGRAIWRAACGAIRTWARRHPQEYALLYGSPVPGYAAPSDTVPPATEVYRALAEAVRRTPRRAARRGGRDADLPPALAADAERVAADLGLEDDPDRVVRLLCAWATVFGLVSLEAFGHTNGVVEDGDALFAHRIESLADDLGI